MGIAERKGKEQKKMETLIVRAAFNLYEKNGADGTSIRKIADRINYSPATIYLYYMDKNAIFYAMQKIAFDKLLVSLHVAEPIDPYNRLRNLGKAYLDFGIEHPKQYELLFMLGGSLKAMEEGNTLGNGLAVFNCLKNAVKECVDQGTVRYAGTLIGCMQCWGIMHGLISLYVTGRMKVANSSSRQSIAAIYRCWDEYMDIIKK